jgi:hypothetical protein
LTGELTSSAASYNKLPIRPPEILLSARFAVRNYVAPTPEARRRKVAALNNFLCARIKLRDDALRLLVNNLAEQTSREG